MQMSIRKRGNSASFRRAKGCIRDAVLSEVRGRFEALVQI